MARYKMTVVFDVHDDEDRTEYEKMKRKRTTSDNARAMTDPTEEDLRFRQLRHNPFYDEFMQEIIRRLNADIGDGVKQSGYPMGSIRTTYEIVSFDKLNEE